MVRQSLNDKSAIDRMLLATDSVEMATAVIDMKEMQRYMLWALAILGFFVWILIVSRGPSRY